MIQITTYLYLTSSIKEKYNHFKKNSEISFKKINSFEEEKIYQDIWPFHHKAPEALRKKKVFSNLQGGTIPMTPLFDEMFSDFDNHHKQFLFKQKNDDFQG
jgi:hypothetical protein